MANKLSKTSADKLVNNKLKIEYVAGSEDPWGEFPSPLYKQFMEHLGRVDEKLGFEDFKPVDWASFNLRWKAVDGSSPTRSIGDSFISSLDFSSSVTSLGKIASYLAPGDPWLFDLDSTKGEVLEVESFRMDLVEVEKPESRIILLDEVSRLQRSIEDIYYDNSRLFKISPREFEEVSAELLRGQGFDVELTKQTRDGGFDMLALRTLGDIPLRFLVECKRHASGRPVTVKMVRELCSVVQTSNANKGLLLTTSYFSKDAKDYRNKHMPHMLDLRDNGDLLAWIKDYLHS